MSPERNSHSSETAEIKNLRDLRILFHLFGKIDKEVVVPAATQELLKEGVLFPSPLCRPPKGGKLIEYPQYTVAQLFPVEENPIIYILNPLPHEYGVLPRDWSLAFENTDKVIEISIHSPYPTEEEFFKLRIPGQPGSLIVTKMEGYFKCLPKERRWTNFERIEKLEKAKNLRVWNFFSTVVRDSDFMTTIRLWQKWSGQTLVRKAEFFLANGTLPQVLGRLQ